VGGSVTVYPTGYADPACGEPFIIVVQPSAGQYVALSAMCPHACCEVSYTGKTPWAFRCPCHGAEFDLTGKSAGIKTKRPLPVLSVRSDSCGVYVTLP
jgi:cytochrome b6-f complex iron-sulfur subunit